MNILENTNTLHNYKFMTKEEFRKNYFYDYNELTYQYLMDKYEYNLDVCKVYLKSMYPIDIDKEYNNQKLEFLRKLKIELLEKNLLILNNNFKKEIENKEIKVIGYYDLERYEEEAIGLKIEIPESELKVDVVECDTLEEEVNEVCLNIIELINKGVDINKIYLLNVSNDYLYTIDKLFSYYNIPINLDMNYSIYGTKVVSDYLKTKEIDLENINNLSITKKLVNVLNSLVRLDKEKKSYNKILIDKLKNTSIDKRKLKNAVNIKDVFKSKIKDDEYAFVLGFNQDILPKLEKDIEYISDSAKEEVLLYKTVEKNKKKKESLIYILSNIKNLHISYKKRSPFSGFYPSSLINDLNLNKIKPIEDKYNKSNIYNELRLGEKLDLYYKYGEKEAYLEELNNHYNIPYKTYSNKFTGIDNNIYLNNIKQPLNLSYSSMNDYSECAFKYYLKSVLKLNIFEEKFPNFIGSMYHYILTLYRNNEFNLDKEFNEYIKQRELTIKERVLLIKIKKDLEELIESLKKQQLITGYDNDLLEKEIKIPIDNKKISVIFKGFIDKIMFYENINTYYSIIDYKTGFIDTNIEPMKYGLHMQLPIYLYLIKYSNILKNPVFTGIYYQNILFNYPTCSTEEEYQKNIKDRLKLQGYSTEDTSVLERFDTTYEKSEYIKSMSYTEEKGFGTYSKVMNDLTLNEMIDYTKNYIDKTTDKILDGKFSINPKHYNGKNISCEFCSFKDICYMQEKDLKYLSKVENLDFLSGGEE